MRSIASTARTFSGCAVGELLAYLSWNSGAALAIHGAATVALAAVPASSSERRVVLSVIAVPPSLFSARGRYGVAAVRISQDRMAGGVRLSNRSGMVHGEFGKPAGAHLEL